MVSGHLETSFHNRLVGNVLVISLLFSMGACVDETRVGNNMHCAPTSCEFSKPKNEWSLALSNIGVFLSTFKYDEGAEVCISRIPKSLELKVQDKRMIVEALKKDSSACRMPDDVFRGASYTVILEITLFRGPCSLLVGVDQLGFGVGLDDQCRFVNPDLSRALLAILRNNKILNAENEEWYRKILANGALGPAFPKSVVEERGGKPNGKSVALIALSNFLKDSRADDIAVRVVKVSSGDSMLSIPRPVMSNIIRCLGRRSKAQGVEHVGDGHGYSSNRGGLEITLVEGLCACVIWLDEGGFSFGVDRQWRFDNPAVALLLGSLLESKGLFDQCPEGIRYKRILEAASRKASAKSSKSASN